MNSISYCKSLKESSQNYSVISRVLITLTSLLFFVSCVNQSGNTSKDTALDALMRARLEYYNNLYLYSTCIGGILELAVQPEDFNVTVSAIHTLKAMADGKAVQFDDAQLSAFEKLESKIQADLKTEGFNGMNSERAGFVLEAVISGLIGRALAILPVYRETGMLPDMIESIEPYMETLSKLSVLSNKYDEIKKAIVKINSSTLGVGGTRKEEYENLERIGTTPSGGPLYDFGNLDSDAKSKLCDAIPIEVNTLLQFHATDYTLHNGKMRSYTSHEKLAIIGGKPFGKDVTVAYDAYFKTFTIDYTDSEGTAQSLHFKYKVYDVFICNGKEYAIWDFAHSIHGGYINIKDLEVSDNCTSYRISGLTTN